jgi:diguanylate cyclase (GGDEF)-like protein
VLIVDIDHFKRVNDSLGHLAGDRVLRLVAATVHHIMRPEDVVARYGGEEFVVIARNTNLDQAAVLAERVREHVAELMADWEGQTVRVTASVGVAVLEPEHPSVEAMIEAADEALYEAKRAGRNCVRAVRGASA